MHILQMLPRLEVGGVERGVLDSAKALIIRGHRVSVISAGGPLVKPLTRLGAAHYQLPVHDKSVAACYACLAPVERLIKTTGVDVVHARSRVPAWIGLIASRRAQRPFVTTAHGFYAPHLLSRVMVWGRLVIAPSEALGRYLVERFRLPRERLRVIPRGVDLDEFAFRPPEVAREGPWRVGLFGRLSSTKGQEVALRACAELFRKGLPVRLCLVGDVSGSPARRSLESLAAELKLQETVEWLGVRHDIAPLIAAMDLMVVPSTYPESFGRGVIEAQAVGRPVVASRLGALAELIEDGETGLLVPPGNPALLAEAIERLIRDASLRARCIEQGRQRVQAERSADRMVERTIAVYEECLTRPRILIWKLSALGDVILSTPSLRAIRRQFPNGHVALVVGRSAYEVVARCPYLTELIIDDPARKGRNPFRRLALIRRLRRKAFDLSVDLQNSRGTHVMAWLAGVPVRIGYRRKLGWLLNRGVRLPRVMLAPVAHQHYLLRQAGVAVDNEALELWPSTLDQERADRLLASGGLSGRRQLVGIHPGGSGRWRTKRWDLDRWVQLCNVLMQHGFGIVVTGGAEEHPIGSALSRRMDAPPLVLIGRTSLMELACLMKRFDVFVAHDSSSLHVASAVGTPTIALFGPTEPRRHLPPAFTGQVIRKEVFCSPCYSTRCRTLTHACMKRISVEEVLKATLGLLADAESAASV